MRHELITCPKCGGEIFIDMEKDIQTCPDCGTRMNRPPIIQMDNYNVAICKDKRIFQYITDKNKIEFNTCTGVVVESKKTPGLFGLTNKTTDTWILTTKSGKIRSISPNEVVPLLIGNQISFGNGTNAIIR